jgi:MFS family permease
MHGTLTDILLFVAAGALAFYTRTIGAVLIAALALTLLLRRNWRWFAAAVALGFLIAAPWLLHARQTRTEGSSYLTQLLSADPYAIDTAGQATALDLGGRLLANASVYFGRDIPLGVFPYLFTGTYSGDPRLEPTVPWSIWIPITLLLVLGAIRAARRIPLTVGYLAFTMIILLLWPSVWASPRFLLPILPLLFMCVFLGLSSIAQLFGSRARPIVLGLLLTLIGFFGIRNAVTLAGSGQAYPGAWAVYFEGASWAGKNLPRESLVIDRKPSLFTVTSGLPATAFPHEPDVDRMLEHFRERGVDYVHVAMISHGDLSEYLFPVVQQRREAFRAVWHREESQAGRRQLRGALFEFVPSGTGGD